MLCRSAVMLGVLFAVTACSLGQGISKLAPEDFLFARGIEIGPTICGASGADPETLLSDRPNVLKYLDRTKWIGYLRRAKNVMEGYNKYSVRCAITLAGDRRLYIDGEGFFCLRTKDPKVFYFYKLDAKDFKALTAEWNATHSKDGKAKGLL